MITSPVRESILKSLKPKPSFVFLKLAGLQFIVSFLSLSVCHQFGVNPFQTSWSLDQMMMTTLGHYGCMIFCGLFFLSLGVALAGVVLSMEELITIKRNQWVHFGALVSMSATFLVVLGAEISMMVFAMWLVGAIAGTILSFQTIRIARLA